MKSNTKKINIIDLFVGCGGLTDGFKKTGRYNSLAAVEWDKPCCKTLIKRLSDKWGYKNASEIVMNFDVQRIKELLEGWHDDDNFGSHKGLKEIVGNENVDVVVGGPPCQAYSIAGRIRDKNGMKDDYRNYLFESYLKVVDFFKPKLFIFENVSGIFSANPNGKLIIEEIRKAFKKIGYEIVDDLKSKALFDVSEYGVPQKRKRVIILGVNNKIYKNKSEKLLNDFYDEIMPSFKVSKKETIESSILDLPALYPDTKLNNSKISHKQINNQKFLNHYPRYHSKRDIDIFKILTKDIEKGTNKYSTSESLKNLYFQATGKKSNVHKYHVLKKKLPSNTIPAHLYKDGLRHIHPDSRQARTITIREAARIQSFDDDFEFLGSMGDQYKMIGNAVPPRFANVIAKSLNKIIKNYSI